jgi:hypothetical protein
MAAVNILVVHGIVIARTVKGGTDKELWDDRPGLLKEIVEWADRYGHTLANVKDGVISKPVAEKIPA